VTAGPIAGHKVDKQAPALTVSANRTAEATGAGGANVGFAPATATDGGSGLLSVSCDRLPGSLFPLGATTVQCTAIDNAGNSSSTSFIVTVVDTTRPVLTVPGNLVVEAQFAQGAYVAFPASATDSVDGQRPVTCSQPSGSLFRFGVSGVFCTASDTRGNTASASFTVTVRDTTAPAPQIFSPKPEDPVTPGGTAAVLVDVTEATQTQQVTVNGINAFPIAQTGQITLRWMASVPVPPGGPLSILVSARDVFGNNSTVSQTLTDNDGIESALDRNRITGANESLVFSSEFNFNGTAGTLTRSGGATVSVLRASGSTVQIIERSGATRVSLCTGTDKYLDLNGANQAAEVTCAPSGTVSVRNNGAGYIYLYKQAVQTYYTTTQRCYTTGGWFNRHTYCYTELVPHTYTYYYQIALAPSQGVVTGSPIVADPANTEPLQVTLLQVDDDGAQNAVADLSVDAGESVDVAVQPGAERQDQIQISALAGDITVAIGGATQTISEGEQPVLPVTVIPTVPRKKAPQVEVPGHINMEATGPGGAIVTFTATAMDPVDGALPVTCSPPSGSVFPLGDTTVSCTATNLGGKSDTDTFKVTVRDTTPPDLVSVTPSLTLLPGTDETVPVSLDVVVADIADAFPVCRITKVRGQGKDLDHDNVIDWTITGDLALNIEANARRRRDRTYTITVTCSDDSQNLSKERTTIVVSQAR
jgi:large repetitive protein